MTRYDHYTDKFISKNELAEFASNSIVGIDANDIMRFPTIPAIPIPENATNGDMIKALFPCEDLEEDFDSDWWNAPYKRGETE